jgi:hypothetical protein
MPAASRELDMIGRRAACILVPLVLAGCTRTQTPVGPTPLPAVRARPLTEVRFEATPERVERGRYLATAVIGCVLCHSERDPNRSGEPPVAGREFAGAIFEQHPGYLLTAPNLTPDVETGAGAWTDDMFARAIREGVGHDGRGIGGPMWWWAFRSLSDEDVASIVVFLRSLPPVHHPLPVRRLPPDLERERAEAASPLAAPVSARDLADPLERGRYLIEVADCMGCHTAWEAPVDPGLGAGGNQIDWLGGEVFSANLTPDPSGLGPVSEDDFVAELRTGRGGTLSAVMPWAAYRGMTDEDLRAIYRALRRLPPVVHWVSSAAAPTHCRVCDQDHGLGEQNVEPVLERVAVDLGPLEAYVGSYRFDGTTLVISARDGALWAAEEGGEPIQLVPIAGGRFGGRGLISPLGFERDASGAVAVLITYDLGETRWNRSP